ncbi:MAG: hypothetical protein C5B52_18620 [Bacteroidetes bacterium]|nr:MAG: hypothetical protein C5B52_18620 [Bacteroidota bacterium]
MNKAAILILIMLSLNLVSVEAQQITGVWEGKINNKRVELKIVQNGDSLTGTSYYYDLGKNYRRYAIKGYFDFKENFVVWWDDHLIVNKSSGLLPGSKKGGDLFSSADFSCPGGDKMWLNGSCAPKDDRDQITGTVSLEKTGNPHFSDEWDYVIENYTSGSNDRQLIEQTTAMSYPGTNYNPLPETNTVTEARQTQKPIPNKDNAIITPEKAVVVPVKFQSNEERLVTRKKIVATEIPLTGDSVELKFYDNAEIDGDSIALFMNEKLMFEHVRLSDTAYSIKISVEELKNHNELTMVAENLGAIPPNTSFMVALVDGKRYEARLESTEQTSATIRFVAPASNSKGQH